MKNLILLVIVLITIQGECTFLKRKHKKHAIIHHKKHNRHNRHKRFLKKSLKKMKFQRLKKMVKTEFIKFDSKKENGYTKKTFTGKIDDLQTILTQFKQLMGVTLNEAKKIYGALKINQYVMFRPVNPGVITQINQKTAVGKGMNIHGKSSKLKGMDGMVPFNQALSKLTDEQQILTFNQYNIHSIEEGAKRRKEVEEYIKNGGICSAAYLSTISDIVGKTKVNGVTKTQNGKDEELNDVEVLGYYIYDSECKTTDNSIKPVVADYDILFIGDCNGQNDDISVANVIFKETVKKSLSVFRNVLGGTKIKLDNQQLQNLQNDIKKFNQITNKDIVDEEKQTGIVQHELMGFAPEYSFKIIRELIMATAQDAQGVVRHSAEIYNYDFPQPFTTEPHFWMRKKADQEVDAQVIFVQDSTYQANIDIDDKSIYEKFQKTQNENGNESQLALISFISDQINNKDCKCVPINLLWTQIDTIFMKDEWTKFYNSVSEKQSPTCPLYTNKISGL